MTRATTALALITSLLFLLALARTVQDRATAARLGPARPVPGPLHHVDINHAQAAELALLPGVGPTLAQAILARRQTVGPFQSVADLTTVRGIGPGRLAQIAPYVVCGPAGKGQGIRNKRQGNTVPGERGAPGDP